MEPRDRKFYEIALFKSPGINEAVKLSIQLTKREIIFLVRAIEIGLLSKDKKTDDLISMLPDETMQQLEKAKEDILKKASLEDYYAEISGMD